MAQAKVTKLTWLNARDGGAGRVRFQGSKKRPAEGDELNALVENAVKAVLTKKNVRRPRPRVTPAQNMSRSTSTSKP